LIEEKIEKWKPIKEFPRYEISNMGNIRKTANKTKFLKPYQTKYGYQLVTLYVGKKKSNKRIHSIVLEAFSCKRPYGMACRHLDCNPKNNNISNLRWGTYKENMEDMFKHGRIKMGSKNPNSKLKEKNIPTIRTLRLVNKLTVSQIAAIYGVGKCTIEDILYGKTWKQIPAYHFSAPK